MEDFEDFYEEPASQVTIEDEINATEAVTEAVVVEEEDDFGTGE